MDSLLLLLFINNYWRIQLIKEKEQLINEFEAYLKNYGFRLKDVNFDILIVF